MLNELPTTIQTLLLTATATGAVLFFLFGQLIVFDHAKEQRYVLASTILFGMFLMFVFLYGVFYVYIR